MIIVYFKRKGCVQQNLHLNSVSRYKKVLKRHLMVRCQVLCNRRRHWPECVGRVNRTFCFTGVSYRAQLLRPISA